jgi:hypothetical protein
LDLPQALDYKMQRAYNWKVKSTGPNEALSLYFLSFRDGQCVYNELPHTLHLRRRQKVRTPNGPIPLAHVEKSGGHSVVHVVLKARPLFPRAVLWYILYG